MQAFSLIKLQPNYGKRIMKALPLGQGWVGGDEAAAERDRHLMLETGKQKSSWTHKDYGQLGWAKDTGLIDPRCKNLGICKAGCIRLLLRLRLETQDRAGNKTVLEIFRKRPSPFIPACSHAPEHLKSVSVNVWFPGHW